MNDFTNRTQIMLAEMKSLIAELDHAEHPQARVIRNDLARVTDNATAAFIELSCAITRARDLLETLRENINQENQQ